MSIDAHNPATKPAAVSGGQLFMLGLLVGVVAGALISAFVTPLLTAPGLPDVRAAAKSRPAADPNNLPPDSRELPPAAPEAQGAPATQAPAQTPTQPPAQPTPEPAPSPAPPK